MDAWSHFVFAFSFAVIANIYPLAKMRKYFIFLIIVEILNFIIAIGSYDYYNWVGIGLRGPAIGYILFKRHQSDSDIEKAQLEQLAVLLFAAVYIAAASHNFDLLFEKSGYLINEHSYLRGHNMWHTPFFALVISLFFTGMIYFVMNYILVDHDEWHLRSNWIKFFVACFIGYFSHIIGDVIVYDFPVYWLFPFDDAKFGILDIINHGNLTSPKTADKPEGTTYFWAIPFFVFFFAFLPTMRDFFQVDEVNNIELKL